MCRRVLTVLSEPAHRSCYQRCAILAPTHERRALRGEAGFTRQKTIRRYDDVASSALRHARKRGYCKNLGIAFASMLFSVVISKCSETIRTKL